jgi:Domain of unknown function (DUF4349)
VRLEKRAGKVDHDVDGTPRRGRRLVGTGTGLLALLVAAPLALSACSGSSTDSASSTSARQPGAAYGGAAPQGGAAAGNGAPQANGGTGSSKTAFQLPSRSLIITAGLQVKTGDAAAAAQRAQITAEGAGGYVSGESIGPGSQTTPSAAPQPVPDGSSGGSSTAPSPVTLPEVTGSSDSTQALLVLRVPPQSVDSVLTALAGKGSVTYQTRNTTDVTGQVADVASRVASAQAAIAELRTLIDKAASMNDLISLEQALSQRESDLESLEAQQKALADQVQYATITVGYFSQGAAVAPPPVHTGFTRGLTVGWHGFLTGLRGILAAVGWLVPYAAVILVLWWPVRRLVRLVRARGARSGKSEPGQTPQPHAEG